MSVVNMPALLKPFELEIGREKVEESVMRFLLQRRGISFHDNTECMFDYLAGRQPSPCTVRLHSLTVRRFGFAEATRLQAVYNRAKKGGYSLCVPEVVFRLLLLQEQVMRAGTSCLFAMEPLLDRGRDHRLVIPKLKTFSRAQGARHTVEMATGDPFTMCPPSTELVFAEVLR